MQLEYAPRVRCTIAIVGLALTCSIGAAHADEREPFLVGDELHAMFAGATLIASHWAEFYMPGGKLIGRVRYLGVTREYAGRWSSHHDRVCFEYTRPEYNTCSHFRRRGEHLHHFGPDGKPKRDGISRRLPGNRLDLFD